MRALVTGAAGFIGSHILERCAERGWLVTGVDSFDDYYDAGLKRRNVTSVRARFPGIDVSEVNLATDDLGPLLETVDVVFHQAGQPGVRSSWGRSFDTYVSNNVLATQRLLEACKESSISRLVYASSSSVYGDALTYPTLEDDVPRPQSPYGVSKLAGEHLCSLYARNHGLPAVSLRYFTVYGPRQRPDMATQRLIRSALYGEEFQLFGDGAKVRDFTFVADVVEANFAAALRPVESGSVFNIAGGAACTVSELVGLVEATVGASPNIVHVKSVPGDVDRTGGSTARAETHLDWYPQIDLAAGVQAQVEWQRSLKDSL